MADRTTASRGGADPKAFAGKTTTPAWSADPSRAAPSAARDKLAAVKRYWPGQAPAWGETAAEEEEAPAAQRPRHAPPVVVSGGTRHVRAPEVVAAPVVVPQPPLPAPAEEELDDEEIDARRAAARQRCVPASAAVRSG